MKEKNISKQIGIIIAFIALFILVAYFWNTVFFYPIKLFTVILHELSHGLAAILTGGSMVKIEINAQIGGLCYTRGGSDIIILWAGYLGSMFFGCLFMIIAGKTHLSRFINFIIALALLILVIGYIRTPFGIIFGILFSLTLFLCSRYAPPSLNRAVLLFLGFTNALYAIVDIKDDLIVRTVAGSDAHAMSHIIPLPPIFWGIVWIALSLFTVFFTLKFILHNKPLSDN